MANSHTYIKNLHKWQSNDNLIAGRLGHSPSSVLPVGNTGPFQSDKLALESFQEHHDVPPYTISGNHIDRLLQWLNELCDKHNLKFFESIVDPEFINVEVGNNDWKWRFEWKVQNGIGGEKTLYVDLSNPAISPPPENYDDTIRGYSWGHSDIWKQIRKAIKHFCLSVNIVPPHTIAEFSETDDEEEESDDTENWWEKDKEIRDSRWFSEENRVEYGLLMPPDDSSPLNKKGIPDEIHLMDGADGVYGTIGQYGVTNTEEYMQYYKKPYDYKKADFFNFRMSKSGNLNYGLTQNIPPNECGVCNTVYKYVTWYRKPNPLHSEAWGYFTYLPSKKSHFLIGGAHDPVQSTQFPYITYDMNTRAAAEYLISLNTPLMCSNLRERFFEPPIWACIPIKKWYAYETSAIGPTCYFNGGIKHYSHGADCVICPPWNLGGGGNCQPPTINLVDCNTIVCGNPNNQAKAYFSPQTAHVTYTDVCVDPTTVIPIQDIHDIIDFTIGYYHAEGPGSTDGYTGLGSLGMRRCSINNDKTAFLECKPYNASDKVYSFYDKHAYTGAGTIKTAFAYDWKSYEFYTESTPVTLAVEKINIQQAIVRSMYWLGSFPSNALMASQTTNLGNQCRAIWVSDAPVTLSTSYTTQCYYPPCDWPVDHCIGLQMNPWLLIPEILADNIITEATNKSTPVVNLTNEIHIPYFNGTMIYHDFQLDDVPFWYAEIQTPFTPTLTIEFKHHYGILVENTTNEVIYNKDYYHPDNVFKHQLLYNIAHPHNTGYVNHGAASSAYFRSWAPNYYNNNLTAIEKSGNWILDPAYRYFGTESNRGEFKINHSFEDWYEAVDSELVAFDMSNCPDIIKNRIQEHYNNNKYEFFEYEKNPEAVVPVSTFAKISSHVTGSPWAWGDTARFSFNRGISSSMEQCISNIDINIHWEQHIHVCATYLHLKDMVNKFGFGNPPVEPGEEATEEEQTEYEEQKMVYRGKLFFGHGQVPHLEGVGAFPMMIFRRDYIEEGYNRNLPWVSDTFDDTHSFAKYTLETWSGTMKIVVGIVTLSEQSVAEDNDEVTWTHELPDHTNQTELYQLMTDRIGDLLDNPEDNEYGEILKEFTYSNQKPTRINPGTGEITIGDIVDFEIDMKDVVNLSSERENTVLFIAHYIDTNEFNNEENPTVGAKFVMPTPRFHWWHDSLIDEETLRFNEDQQIYGGYADVFENIEAIEIISSGNTYMIDHDRLWNSLSHLTPDILQNERVKTVEFYPYTYPAEQNWFGTPSGNYYDYVVKSMYLTVGDASGPTLPYQGRFGNVPTYKGFAYSHQKGTPHPFQDTNPEIFQRSQPHIAFKIPWPLFKVGDKSAGGNTDGNDENDPNVTQWTNDQLTPHDLVEETEQTE